MSGGGKRLTFPTLEAFVKPANATVNEFHARLRESGHFAHLPATEVQDMSAGFTRVDRQNPLHDAVDKCVESMFHELQSHRAHVYELDSVYINTDDPHTRNFAASKPFKSRQLLWMAVDAERFRLMLQGRPEAMRVQQSELVAAFGPGFWFSECPQEVLNEWADCTSVGGASIMRKTAFLMLCAVGGDSVIECRTLSPRWPRDHHFPRPVDLVQVTGVLGAKQYACVCMHGTDLRLAMGSHHETGSMSLVENTYFKAKRSSQFEVLAVACMAERRPDEDELDRAQRRRTGPLPAAHRLNGPRNEFDQVFADYLARRGPGAAPPPPNPVLEFHFPGFDPPVQALALDESGDAHFMDAGMDDEDDLEDEEEEEEQQQILEQVHQQPLHQVQQQPAVFNHAGAPQLHRHVFGNLDDDQDRRNPVFGPRANSVWPEPEPETDKSDVQHNQEANNTQANSSTSQLVDANPAPEHEFGPGVDLFADMEMLYEQSNTGPAPAVDAQHPEQLQEQENEQDEAAERDQLDPDEDIRELARLALDSFHV